MSQNYRSLYWRIGLCFIGIIAAVLAIQGIVLLWLVNEPDQEARTTVTAPLARALGDALANNPSLDIKAFAERQLPTPPRPYYIIMTSGDAYFFGKRRPSDVAVQTVREVFQMPGEAIYPRNWDGAPYWSSPLQVNGTLRGIVAVVPRDQIAELWPRMAALAFALFTVGTMLASQFIFRPAHRRLKALESTARRLGAGDINARAVEDGGDEVASLAATFNRMARDLAEHAAQIDTLDRTRRSLLADISHELMTPLTAIRGYQEKLAADPGITASHQHRRYVSIIGEEALRVERIVRDLLDLARFESGGNVLDIQDVSIEGLFGRVASRHDAEAKRRNVRLVTAIDPGAEIVRGDQFRLEQALQNLAANALRHGSAPASVELHATLFGGEIVITVRDTGSGIAARHLPFVFDRFYKADSSRAAIVEGSGLGLSIVKAIVERHGGTIAVTSEPHVETIFTIRLPAVTGPNAAALSRSA